MGSMVEGADPSGASFIRPLHRLRRSPSPLRGGGATLRDCMSVTVRARASDLVRLWPLAPATLIFAGLFVAPLTYFLVISFWSVRARIMRPDLTLKNYLATFTEYGDTLVDTLILALLISLSTTILAFGFAWVIRFRAGRWANALLFLTLITLFGGYLVKIYAWKSILGRDGILNLALVGLGMIDEPSPAFIYNANGIVITLTYFLLPFAVLPIYSSCAR